MIMSYNYYLDYTKGRFETLYHSALKSKQGFTQGKSNYSPKILEEAVSKLSNGLLETLY